MQLRFRNYTHDLNENLLGVSVIPTRNEMGIQHESRVVWNIQGKLIGTSQSNLLSKIDALKAAYNGSTTGDAVFSHNGTTIHRLTDSQTRGGVRVIAGPDFPPDIRAYVGYVPYTIALEAIFPDPLVRYLSFHEAVSFEGGGPLFDHLTPVEGLPQKQLTHQNTVYRAVQAGTVVGHLSYPLIPGPIWPSDQKEARKVRPHSPTRDGNALVGFAIDYEYVFESSRPLSGLPNIPPLG